MKKKLLYALLLSSVQFIRAQSPSLICYQAVATNSSGAELTSTDISVRIAILEEITNSNSIYTELHDVTTDQFGLFTLDIGSKSSLNNNLSNINWATGKYYLKVEMAAPKGTAYRTLGVNQLLSVPYSLYASKSDTASFSLKSLMDKDIDPTNELQGFVFDKSNYKLKLTADSLNASSEVIIQDADADITNEIQTLKFDSSNGKLSLVESKGNISSTVNIRDGLFSSIGASTTYPQGIFGKYRFIKKNSVYVVPPGKIFYTTANGNAQGELISAAYKGNHYMVSSYPNCPVFPEGTTITNSILTGFEADTVSYITSVIIDLKSPYTVPPNKTLFIKTGFGIGNFTLIVDDELTSFYSVNSGSQIPTIYGGVKGTTIKYAIGSPLVLTGYLIDAF